MKVSLLLKLALGVGVSAIVGMMVLYNAVLFFMPFPQQEINSVQYSTEVLDKEGDLLYAFLNDQDRWQLPVDLKELDPRFIAATLAIEDRNFYHHFGVDVSAIIRAAFLNITNGRIISGASTISMQTMRLIKRRKRSFFNKIIEAVYAIHLERQYTKDEILKLYFELAPYGGNVHGVRAASLRYLNKEPTDLTLAESALIAGLPQSPSRLRPDRHPQRAKKRRDMVLKAMLDEKAIDGEVFLQSSSEPVLVGRYTFPQKAPHFSLYVKGLYKKDKRVRTSLDSRLQSFIERSLKSTVEGLRAQGVTNGAVVVIENKTGKVRAFVGSADFFSVKDEGQVNGVLSRRSPGSALKPFTYALALDTGAYSTRTLIDDAPSRYAQYMPQNFDKSFRGLVSLREALVDSLNIPAVEVLDYVGVSALHRLLSQAGLKTLSLDPDHYGLSLTLGSPDIRLLELANAYAMLARLGVEKPFTVLERTLPTLGRRLINKGTAYIVSDILSDTSRLNAVGVYRDDTSPKIAFKTGTSAGQRDAWSFAYNPEYTIGVWIGNFDAKPSKALLGIKAATPLSVRIFDWLYSQKTLVWYETPDTVIVKDGDDLSVKTARVKSRYQKKSVFDPTKKPEIVSPANGAEYYVSGIKGGTKEMNLQAKAPSEADKLYWFVNGALFKTASPQEKVFMPLMPGMYHITCADNFGRSANVQFVVR